MTLMADEAGEAPALAAAQRCDTQAVIAALAGALRAAPPRVVATIARGSSDNAATYARYLIELKLGIVTASMSPSVASVYRARPDMAGMLALAVSQSGRSPDLVAAARTAADAGARVVALVNDTGSPLAALADTVLPIAAGREASVAATKSFIGSLTAIAALVAAWSQDAALDAGLVALPDWLAAAWALDWSAALPTLAGAEHLFVIGRGPGFAVAQEAALKFKETCGLHAEAFSAAEVRHGPMTLVGRGFPLLAFLPDDETRGDVEAMVAAFRDRGARVFAVGGDGPDALPVIACHPLLLPIVQVQAFYRLVDRVAAARGHDPDAPAHLSKVTETL